MSAMSNHAPTVINAFDSLHRRGSTAEVFESINRAIEMLHIRYQALASDSKSILIADASVP
jgi:hypothetical protein